MVKKCLMFTFSMKWIILGQHFEPDSGWKLLHNSDYLPTTYFLHRRNDWRALDTNHSGVDKFFNRNRQLFGPRLQRDDAQRNLVQCDDFTTDDCR